MEIMEGIVVGIAQINFHQNLSEITNKNSATNLAEFSTIMSAYDSRFPNSEESTNVGHQDSVHCFSNNLIDEETIGDSVWEEIEDDLGKIKRNRMGYTLAERRQMPARASKESSLLGIKRRTIKKPAKRVKNHEDFQNLKPADIKKIYLNKMITNFKPSCLETIFEEMSTFHNNEKDCNRLMGNRKIKRSLSFSDGFRYSKVLVNKRRAKIKKTFGKRFALKKISLEEFISRLNTTIEKHEDVSNHDSGESEIAKEFSYSDFCTPNTSVNTDDEAKIRSSTGFSNEFTNDISLVDK